MKDLILLFIYLYCIISFVSDFKVCVVLLMLAVFFLLKYIRLKISLNNYKHRTKKMLKKILNKERISFTETLIHDIKIPTLAQLRGVDLIKKETLGSLNNEQQELLSQVGTSCKYVLEMISMLTNAYRFDNGTYKPVYERFSLSELLISCFEELTNDVREKNITFSCMYNSDTTIEADKDGIRKVILNMLLSIISYSNNGDEIIIKIDSEGNQLVFSAQGKNFDGIDISSKYSTVGHRIGLYLCKKIVEYHRGQIYTPSKTNSVMFKIPRVANFLSTSAV